MSMSLNMQINGMAVALDEVVDGATNATYTRITSPAQMASKTWKKDTSSSGGGSGSDMLVGSLYGKLSQVKLIGTEQVNGVATWHLQGTVNGSSSDGAETIDVYVHQSDYLPAELVVHSTGTDPVDATLIYTSLNSGVSIDLPTV